ncbi:hypothetical protein [Streptomyces sp. NPDC058872]|uniref:hypothetical protein n=1 Tax=Streptomyces sp. NPDC058872 TaxID=3346661 RepID=UPI0036849D32
MRRTRPARMALVAALTLLTPLVLDGQVVAAGQPLLTLANPGFELGSTGWTFTPGTGVASNIPHGGTKLVYLDAGAGRKVSQTVTAAAPGTYDFSAWIATGGPGARFVVRVNGVTVGAVALPSRPTYARHTVSRVELRAGDRLEAAFESGDGWVNADDLMISPGAPADPVVTSSDPKAVEMFDWAKRKANSWVQLPGTVGPLNVDERYPSGSGTAVYGPSYWAGYAHRSAFYSRDMVHQLGGAAVLGLHEENKSMLRAFAASSTVKHKYFPVWAVNFDDETYLSIDYRNPHSYVREVPAPFELVEKADEAYRWSGDPAYLDDPVLWDFYRHTTEEFIALHDARKPNGVAEGTGDGIFAGAASYNEVGEERLAESGDAIASQYRAYLAMAALAESKGDSTLAADSAEKAADLKEYFNTTWSGTGSGGAMVRGYTVDGQALTGWGKENSWFMPMKQLIDPGARNDAYLDYVDQQASGDGKPTNIEAISYLPDTFFAHDRNDTAWKWMNYVYDQRNVQHPVSRQGPNGDYPEVSYTLVDQTVKGLLGLAPDAPNRRITTQSRLPAGMDWLKIDQLEIGGQTFALRHDGSTKSTLTNYGSAPYTWEARFPGQRSSVTVDGTAWPIRTTVVNGTTYTYADIAVQPGRTVTVEVG